VCVCLYMSAVISSEPYVRSSPNVLRMLSMVAVRSSSGGVVIILVLSGFMDDVKFAHNVPAYTATRKRRS